MNPWPESRYGVIAAGVVVLVSGLAAAQMAIFAFADSLTVEDPIGDDSDDTFSWSAETTETKTFSCDTSNSTYLLRIDLVSYGGETGRSAICTARENESRSSNNDGDHISDFYVTNSNKGVKEQTRRDLISDGSAFYYHLPESGGSVTLEVYADSAGTVEVGRSAYVPDEISVRTHRQVESDACEDCHAYSSPPHVHQDMGSTNYAADDWQNDTCVSCHDNTMTDLHQDCDTACHDGGYPIVSSSGQKHGPDQNGGDMVEGEYFCSSGSGCHHDSGGSGAIGAVHVTQYGEGNYCPKCHDSGSDYGSIVTQHTRSGFEVSDYEGGNGECSKCHGVGWTNTHDPAKNMGMRKRGCGGQGCHGGGGGGGWGGDGW